MEKLMKEYILELRTTGRNSSNPYLSLKLFLEYLKARELDLLSVRLKDAEDFQIYLSTMENKERLRYGKKTVINIVGNVRMFYASLKRKNIASVNPFNGITRIRANKELPKDIPREEELEKLLESLRDFGRGNNLVERRSLYKAHVIAELMYSTGMRMSELESLRVEDIDFTRSTVKVKDCKTKTERLCVLNEYASKILEIYVKQMREYVIFGKNGGDGNLLFGARKNVQIWFNKQIKTEAFNLGMKRITSHYFRHAVGCYFLKAGCDIRVIQEILGHKELSSTQIYTKVDKENLKSVIDNFHPRQLKRRNADEDL
jgi:site-specific recombinase XerD